MKILLLFKDFVLYFTGKYIQMMRLLKPIAFDVMTCMAQLFDFYMYSVSDVHCMSAGCSKYLAFLCHSRHIFLRK